MHFLVLFTALVACAAGVPLNATTLTLDDRIVGGTTTKIQNHPFQVSLRYNGNRWCGASIISRTWVVTAAHCVNGRSANTLTIRAGSTYLSSGGTIHNVTRRYIHSGYNTGNQDYDVAVLQVSPAFAYSSSVRNITLESNSVASGTNVVVTGWGTTSAGGPSSNTLRQVTVQTLSDASCRNSYPGKITDRMICAGTASGGKGPCNGDSGGPLVASSRLVGIVSWGPEICGLAGKPAVFTKVSAVRSWIRTNTGV